LAGIILLFTFGNSISVHRAYHIMFLTVISLQGVDLLAGVEAIISHLIVKEFKIPAAHAPAVLPPLLSPLVCPQSAAEEVSMSSNTRLICLIITQAWQCISQT
jgi:hypothetical protein